jgi:hypothetical protein
MAKHPANISEMGAHPEVTRHEPADDNVFRSARQSQSAATAAPSGFVRAEY